MHKKYLMWLNSNSSKVHVLAIEFYLLLGAVPVTDRPGKVEKVPAKPASRPTRNNNAAYSNDQQPFRPSYPKFKKVMT